MPELHVFTGNRLECLAERLASVLERPLSSPLAAETIVVPNQGVARWLSLWLADRFGVWANFRFLAPDELLLEAVRAVVPGTPDASAFAPEVLSWRILKHLPSLSTAPEVHRYLADDPAGIKGFQLARRIAETFELYGVFRPEMLLAWERGNESDWQADLWRLLASERPGAHKAALTAELLRRAPGASPAPGSLPERVSVFGIAALAPLRLRVLGALAGLTEMNLFALNPSSTYWGQIVSAKEAARARRRAFGVHGDEGALHLEVGNPLLASLGRLGRDFSEELLERAEAEGSCSDDCFVDPGGGTLLSCLQSDILHLRDRGADGAPKTPVSPGDRSLQIHSCHSPLRELEVLHDRLLELFETAEGLRPGDVFIATPDIEAYAPYIEAVFGACPDPSLRIPYAVADRPARARSLAIDGFLRVLDLHGSRFGASEVLDLLEIPDVRRKFALGAADRETIRRWVEATRIRWGVDAEDRRRRGLPAFEENTWRAGLRRLLLGYALPADGGRLFQGLLPFDDVEGEGARVLGAFADFAETLFSAVGELDRPRSLGSWAACFGEIAERFLEPDEAGEREMDALRRELSRLAEIEGNADLRDPLDLRVVRRYLGERLEHAAPAGGIFTGKVTFSGPRHLGGVPFRMVGLIGMNDGVFPRSSRPPGFDRMAAAPRRGDPSLRDEDRHLFLQALLSAREFLYLSYVGQSARDNSEAPPSVLVSELLDAVEQGFEAPDGGILERVVVRHRLQAFSPAYFGRGGAHFSYSRENFEAVKARGGAAARRRPFLPEPLGEPEPELRTVDVARLAKFFVHPAKFFLRERLGVRLEREAFEIEEREPFEVGGLDRYKVEGALTARVLENGDAAGEREVLRARGILPPGGFGDADFDALRRSAQELADRVRPHLRREGLPPLELDLPLGEFRMVGRLSGVWPEALVRFRSAKVKAEDRLRLWVEHLALCCSAPPGYPETSVFVGSDGGFRYTRPNGCRDLLRALLELYWEGLRSPLPFFPATSLEYVRKEEGALGAARRKWEGNDFSEGTKGERDDPYNRLCFRDSEPLGEPFQTLAGQVLGPLLAHEAQP